MSCVVIHRHNVLFEYHIHLKLKSPGGMPVAYRCCRRHHKASRYLTALFLFGTSRYQKPWRGADHETDITELGTTEEWFTKQRLSCHLSHIISPPYSAASHLSILPNPFLFVVIGCFCRTIAKPYRPRSNTSRTLLIYRKQKQQAKPPLVGARQQGS